MCAAALWNIIFPVFRLGRCFIDADVLADAGVTDLSGYGGGDNPVRDIFLDRP